MGCADPQGDFDAFTERYASIHGTTTSNTEPGACAAPEAGAIDGDHLLTLSVTLSPKKPVLFVAGVTTTAMGSGLGLSMTIQALSAADRTTLVGDVTTVGPYEVGADGAFVADLPELTVPAEANGITGSQIKAKVVLTGNLCADALSCGTVTGTAVVNVDGSNFTLQKIDDPAEFPEAVINCAGETAPLAEE